MTEDEAFVRAVVDGPGDDTPRLVYADWLDDRNDPRCAYLRAEAEWFAPTPNKAQAVADLNFVRTNSGGLPPSSVTVFDTLSAVFAPCADNDRIACNRHAHAERVAIGQVR